jgi:hypothetical protein
MTSHAGCSLATPASAARGRYQYRLGQAASYTQPEHITAFLGPLPERVGQVER